MIGLGLSIVQLAVRAGLGFARGSSLALDFTSGNRTLDPRITFSRTTNATVTGSNGLIQFAPMNLLTFSEQFDNAAWSKQNTTVTANVVTAPDGTSTADALIPANGTNAASGVFRVDATASPKTLSCRVKKGSKRWAFLLGYNGTSNCWFDLDLGVVGTRGANFSSSSITALNDGWYLLSASFNSAIGSQTNLGVYCSDSDNSQVCVGDGSTAGIFLWGAQLEIGSTATTYNPTTVKNLLGFTEHFDNAAWTKSNSFVQTNLLTNSEAFDNAVWLKTASTVVANTTAAPDGSMTADLLYPNTTGNNRGCYQSAPSSVVTTAVAKAFSIYAKAAGLSHVYLQDANAGAQRTWFNVATGTVGTTAADHTASIVDVGNGWYRCIVSTSIAWGAGAVVGWQTANADNSIVSTANGTDGVFIWGAQLVQGTTPGDYKATYATAAAVGYTDIYGQPFAQKLVADSAASTHFIQQNTTGALSPYTWSVYAKAGELSWLCLNANDATNRFTFFNLSNGTIGTNAAGNTPSIQDMGNGWYRCAVTRTAANTAISMRLFLAPSDNVTSYTGDGTSGIYIFGAQLSDSASVDPYVYQPVAAPASTAYYGPRFDYDPVTLAPKGLLIEEQRTNLLTYSEDFANAAWVTVTATVAVNTAVSPSGATTAATITADGSSNTHFLGRDTATFNLPTLSVFLKKGTNNFAQLRFFNDTVRYANFDLNNGTASGFGDGNNATITAVANGWYRCSITSTTSITGFAVQVVTGLSAVRNETNTLSTSIFIYGAQLEAGSFATSYIPTVQSQVTRAADSASMIGNNFARWYNQTEGSLFADYFQNNSTASGGGLFAFSDNTNNNRILLTADGGSSGSIQPGFVVTAAGVAQVGIVAGTGTQNSFNKLAGAYEINNFACSFNGAAVVDDTSGILPVVDRAYIGLGATGATPINGTISRIAYYPRRLANTELTALTS
jgi:hypothetical protein